MPGHCRLQKSLRVWRLTGLPLLLGWLLSLGAVESGQAASGALIVAGLSPAENAADLKSLATKTQSHLVQRGLPEDRVKVLADKPTREQVLQQLHTAATGTSTNDEFWLVLFGVTGRAANGGPAFQVSGPRLTADDLKTALDAIPARQFVFIGTGNSGAFLPPLQAGRRTILSATRAEGQPDQPRFLDAWVEELGDTPKAAFAEIAARAAARIAADYPRLNLAQTEHAQLADPATGRILDAPFGVTLAATNRVAQSK